MNTSLLAARLHYYRKRRETIGNYSACKVLGIDEPEFFKMSEEEQANKLKESFRKKAREVHPDTNPDPKEKERLHEEFNEVNQAYAFLKDDELKKAEREYYQAQEAWRINKEEKRKAAQAAAEAARAKAEEARERAKGAKETSRQSGQQPGQTGEGPTQKPHDTPTSESTGQSRRSESSESTGGGETLEDLLRKARERGGSTTTENETARARSRQERRTEYGRIFDSVFASAKDEEFFYTFTNFYQEKQNGQKQGAQEQPFGKLSKGQVFKEILGQDLENEMAKIAAQQRERAREHAKRLKELTQEFMQEHRMPKAMFTMYLKAISELAKVIVRGDEVLTGQELRSSLEYQLVESYQRLLVGGLCVTEMLGHYPVTSFQSKFDGSEVKYFLKQDMTDDEINNFDNELRMRVRVNSKSV